LTPPAKHSIPAARDRLVKAAQSRPVARQTVVGVVPPQHAAQPAMLCLHRCVHAAPHLRLDLVQLPSHALSLGPPLDHIAPVPTPRAVVREAEKRNGPRSQPPRGRDRRAIPSSLSLGRGGNSVLCGRDVLVLCGFGPRALEDRQAVREKAQPKKSMEQVRPGGAFLRQNPGRRPSG